jgi:hypothetical protein
VPVLALLAAGPSRAGRQFEEGGEG